ncbi:hypothetical protein SLS59_003614 [Nothophoma quercina]|uniref:Uncharacterized protein n=1 Tax=Nothophoma quercina TaxID=749835 RepID=A0ABR3RMZ9_9PLEO
MAMWANKKPNGVYGASTMEAHLKGADKTEGAILTMKLRYLVGARTYHRNKWVTDTLKKQKERIEKILGELDSELTKHIPSWQKQDFSKRWNEYMDQHFLDAEKRWDADLQKWFAKLDKVFGRIDPKQKKPGPNDDLIKTIEAVRKAWKKESAISWAKPW